MAAAIIEAIPLRERVDEVRARRIDIMIGALQVASGEPGGERLLDRYHRDRPASGGAPADSLFLAEVLAPSLAFLRRTAASEALLDELDADFRARGAVRPLISVLGAQAVVQYGRSFPATMASAMEAINLAETNDTPELASLAAGVLTLCAAAIGDREACEQAAALLATVPEPERRAMGPIGLGYLALNQGRLDDALAIYRDVAAMSPIGRGLVRWEPEYMETLIRLGHRKRAAEILDEIEHLLTPEQLWPHGIGRPKGMLAEDDDEAAEYFGTTVVAAEQIGNLVGAGRTEILWGERLRRARRRAEARTHLEHAVELLRGDRSDDPRRAGDHRAPGGRRRGRRGHGVAPAAVPARAAGRPARRRRGVQPGPRGEAVHQPTHRRGPPHGDLPQARRAQPPRAQRPSDRRPCSPAIGILTMLRHVEQASASSESTGTVFESLSNLPSCRRRGGVPLNARSTSSTTVWWIQAGSSCVEVVPSSTSSRRSSTCWST